MKKMTLSLAAVAALVFVGFDTKSAEAAHGFGGFGFHYGGPLFHVDVGNPHGFSRVRSHRVSHHTPAHYDWHDTSHFDYVPARNVRHGNHYDYVPARVEYHETGHWDRHHGGHH